MRIASTPARFLRGLIFLVFGLSGFFHFLPLPAPTDVAGQFLVALFVSHYLNVIFLLQVIPAILLPINRYVPLALTLLGPVVVNIFCFHAFMEPSGLPLALVTVILWAVVYFHHRSAFAGLFQQRVQEQGNVRTGQFANATR